MFKYVLIGKLGASVHLLDRMGRNPLQLAESKLKLLQKRNIGENYMQIHCEVMQVKKSQQFLTLSRASVNEIIC